MRKIFNHPILLVTVIGLVLFASCNKDNGEDPVLEFDAPTITITSPDIPDEGLITEVGATTTFSISVAAEAGLSTIKLNDDIFKTYTGTEKEGNITHDFLPLESGVVTLSFEVEDALGKTASVSVTVTVEEGIDLGYLLIDFAGALTSTEDKVITDWDERKLFTFGVSGSHSSSATAEVANLQAILSFAQDNPSKDNLAKVLKVEKVITDTDIDNWGGWAHIIFNLGSAIHADTINALPVWNAVSSTTTPGTKIVQIDAYYDATVDTKFTWDSLSTLEDIWNADPTQGYKVDLQLGSYDPMGITEGGYDGAFYMGYYSYIPEPNKWVTLSFELIDEGRTSSMYGVSADAPEADAIDCVKIIPSPGYSAQDANPLYFKNLRIVDVQ